MRTERGTAVDVRRYQLVRRIVLQVADLPESERQAAILQACGSDAELRMEILELLVYDDMENSAPGRRNETEPTNGQDTPPDH